MGAGGADTDGPDGRGAWHRFGGRRTVFRDSGDDGDGLGQALPEGRCGRAARGSERVKDGWTSGGGERGQPGPASGRGTSEAGAPRAGQPEDSGCLSPFRGPGHLGNDRAPGIARGRSARGPPGEGGKTARRGAEIRACGAEPALALGHFHVSPETTRTTVRHRVSGRLLAVRGFAGGGAPPEGVARDGGAAAGHCGVRSAPGSPHRSRPAVHGLAWHDGIRGGAQAPRHPAHQEPAPPSADTRQDGAVLEDAMGRIPVADGVCGLRGLRAADRPLRPGL